MKVLLSGGGSVARYRRPVATMGRCRSMGMNSLTPEEIRFIIESSPNPEYTYNLLMSGGFWDIAKKVGGVILNPVGSAVKAVTNVVAPKADPIVSSVIAPGPSFVQTAFDKIIEKKKEADAAAAAAKAAKAEADRQASLKAAAQAAGLAQAAAIAKRDQMLAEQEANAAAAASAKAKTEAIVAERQLATVTQPAEQEGSGIAKLLPFAALAAIPLFLSGK